MRIRVSCSPEIARMKPDHAGTRPAMVDLVGGARFLYKFGHSPVALNVTEKGLADLEADRHLKVELLDPVPVALVESPPPPPVEPPAHTLVDPPVLSLLEPPLPPPVEPPAHTLVDPPPLSLLEPPPPPSIIPSPPPAKPKPATKKKPAPRKKTAK